MPTAPRTRGSTPSPAPTAPADTPPTTTRQRRPGPALALLAATQFLVVVDASIVNVALPSIATALSIDQQNISWVINAYILVFGGGLLLGGRLADLLGRRAVFITGIALFALASLAGGLAQSLPWLVSARAVQGLGAALASPAALSIITNSYPQGAERNRALGVWGAVAGGGGAAGVLLGGVLTQLLDWRWVLFVNVPIGLAIAVLAPRLITESREDSRQRSVDVPGAVLVTGGLGLLVYTLVGAQDAGWLSARTLALGAAALVALVAFLAVEARSRQPLLPLGVLRCAPCAAPTSAPCWSARRSSRCSSSSPCTCSRCCSWTPCAQGWPTCRWR